MQRLECMFVDVAIQLVVEEKKANVDQSKHYVECGAVLRGR